MRLKAFRWTAASTIATSLFVAACNLGESYYYGSAGGFGGVGGVAVDGGAAPEPRSACELAEEGRQCFSTPVVEECEVKQHANPACNEGLSCKSSYTWASVAPARDDCSSDCPSTFVADRPDACAGPNAGSLICEYPEGTCGCAPIRPVSEDSDAGDAGEPADDAGDIDAGPTAYEWRCVTPEAGCPRKRPAIGAGCVRPMDCDYGDCLFEDGVTMHCYSSTWVSEKRCDR